MTTDKSFRINLTVSASDMDRLKDMYHELIAAPGRVSFTSFCYALLMTKCGDLENGGRTDFGEIPKRGRPKVSE